jgi:anti-sigma B factor antagonist
MHFAGRCGNLAARKLGAMKIQPDGTTLLISGLTELNASNAGGFRDDVRAALTPQITHLDVDMSETRFLDSSGLGALIALHKTLSTASGSLRILRPTATARQILELTRLHRMFEIVTT